METEPTVFVIDDDPDCRQTLAWLIETAGLAVRSFDRADAFLAAYDPELPGCLVSDVRLRGMSGLELLEHLGGAEAPLPVILVTGYGEFSVAVRAFRTGAVDILQKPIEAEEVIARVRQALILDGRRRALRTEQAEVAARVAYLTPRERAVLELLLEGKANKQIAADLDISVRTVETHRANVLGKMAAGSSLELVRRLLHAAPALASLRSATERCS